ncbi:MAG: 2-oxoacid:ferredoxin oxidoreductase subunit beta [Candidatus Krumholzibacteria bacterium]|nr:2-oxoacid:ferredoxin oxidoreductase subunit beta [Candidatus Krumholzibacteria bacterium]
MATIEEFGEYETAWCPGCGNFALLEGLKQGLAASGRRPRDLLFVSGIGQAAKAPHYLNANVFNGLHGRALPAATGAKLADPRLTVIVESGDGCCYGEGGNHFLAAIRRNVDLTMIVHDNMIYGLTKGQASPTSQRGHVTKAQPGGAAAERFDPVSAAIALGAGFVARAFVGDTEHLAQMVAEAIAYRGFSLVDVFQPCVSFNRVNTFAWYKKRCYRLPAEYDPSDREAALRRAGEWGDRIPIGVLCRADRPVFEDSIPALSAGPLAGREVDRKKLSQFQRRFG